MAISDKRRFKLIFFSVGFGIVLSLLMYKLRKGTLDSNDYFFLGTIFVFSFALIAGLSFAFKKWEERDGMNN